VIVIVVSRQFGNFSPPGRYRMVVTFITIYAISAYHH